MSTTETTTQDRADAGAFHAALVEIAEIIECGVVAASELPDKVRELVTDLRAEDARLRRELAVTNGKLGTRGGDISDLLDVNRRLTKENADLRRDLAKAERHDADVRFEAETDVRAELAEKAGA